MAKRKPKTKVNKFTGIEEILPHLGGSENITNTDPGVLEYLINTFDVNSMVDIGCGPGGQIAIGKELGLRVLGVDGDYLVKKEPSVENNIVIHDFTKGELFLQEVFDLGYTVEFVEHVEEIYIKNWMRPLMACKHVLITHAYPNQEGWHHVSLHLPEYWIDVFTAFGFVVDVDGTNEARNASTMQLNFMRQQGLLFHNINNPESYTLDSYRTALNNLK